MNSFNELGLPRLITNALERLKFSAPTPIQAQAIPAALSGRDILGTAQTGTGKTAAYAIPLLAKLLKSPQGSALVMMPTRELATQVMQAVLSMVDRSSGLRAALLIGGESMHKQLMQLQARPRIIIGTPGRINDHLERGSLRLGDTSFLVLDETDRMLDMGFGVQIDRIIKRMPAERQTLMFSATLPDHILKLSGKYMNNPERIAVGSVSAPAARIKQDIVRTQMAGKYESLLAELETRDGSIIVFVKTKHGADRMAGRLDKDGHGADAIHGNLKQSKRDRVIKAFRAREFRVLVATDVAARGLDVPHVEHVINYDLPQCPEDYIHRIGRTARAGAEGAAVCLLTPEDGSKWAEIQRLLNPGEAGHARSGGARPPQKAGGGNKNWRSGKGRGHRKGGAKDASGNGGRQSSFGGRPAQGRPQGNRHGDHPRAA